jgi:hypothetical protein
MVGFDFGFRGFRGLGRLAVALVLMGAAAGGFAQEAKTTLVVPPAPLLPITSQLVEGGTIPADGAETQAILKEDGLQRQASRVTVVPVQPEASKTTQTAESGWVTAYQFVDATGAYSAFSYLGAGGKRYPGERLSANDVQLPGGDRLFLSGTSVVRAHMRQYPESVNALLRTIETGLPKVAGPKGLAPLLPTYLPVKGLEANSVRYSLGPMGYRATGGILPGEILGFDKAGEVVTAKYAGKGTLTLLMYPTPQIAGDHGRQIEAEIRRLGAPAGTVMLRREGPLVLLTTGSWKAADARAMVEGIHLRQAVTFDRKMPLEFHAEVQKTYSLLTSIMVFCGVGALAAIILGLFLGVGRAWIRVLMGKPAASEPEFLRIDLHGQSAPIHLDGPAAGPQG